MKRYVLLTAIMLAGCTGPGEFFEPMVFGVEKSKWEQMSSSEKQAAKQDYYHEEQMEMQRDILNEQKRRNDILEKQIKDGS